MYIRHTRKRRCDDRSTPARCSSGSTLSTRPCISGTGTNLKLDSKFVYLACSLRQIVPGPLSCARHPLRMGSHLTGDQS